MADWNLGGLNWSDNPVLVAGNEGEGGTAMYQTPGYDFSQSDWNQLGYNGQYGTDPISENGTAQSNEFAGVSDWLSKNNYRVGQAWDPSGSLRYSGLFGQNNKMIGNPIMHDLNDNDFGLAMQLAAGLMGGVGLGAAGVGTGFFGGGLPGNIIQGATMGSISAGLGGGNPFTGALTGGLSGGTVGALNPASMAGIENPSLAKVFNNSVGAGVNTAIRGGEGSDILKSMATTGVTSGLNEGGKYLASSLGGNNMNELPWNDNPGMSFSLPNMGQVGNWALNNAGDLAGMLYGFMNNRKQQRQLGGMMSGLQGLYSQNSPYAQQLRQSLAAKDAAAGRRSQYANREVQLQSNLAHMASQQIPAMNQMQMGISNLQNRNMMNLLNSAKTMGIWDGLKGMFGGRQQQPQLQAPAYGSNLGGLTNMFDPQGSAMFNPNFTPSQQTNWNGANDDYGNPLGS